MNNSNSVVDSREIVGIIIVSSNVCSSLIKFVNDMLNRCKMFSFALILKHRYKNKDYLLANMNDHNIYFKKTLLFKGRKTPLNLLLETFHDRIINGYQKEDLDNIFISSETIKIIENGIRLETLCTACTGYAITIYHLIGYYYIIMLQTPQKASKTTTKNAPNAQVDPSTEWEP